MLKSCGMQDVEHIAYLLSTRFGFQDITMLRDDDRRYPSPTKRNILSHIDQLVAGAQPGDSLFFQFSGTQTFLLGHGVLVFLACNEWAFADL
jgi:hypothetical protein